MLKNLLKKGDLFKVSRETSTFKPDCFNPNGMVKKGTIVIWTGQQEKKFGEPIYFANGKIVAIEKRRLKKL